MSTFLPMRIYQTLLTPITSRLLYGCHYNRTPQSEVESLQLFQETEFSRKEVSSMYWYHPERTQVSAGRLWNAVTVN